MTEEGPDVPGAAELRAWFGRWPSFHDAEVHEVHLARGGSSWIDAHAWLPGPPAADSGVLERERECVVRITLSAVTNLDLHDFSAQNVVSRVSFDREGAGWRVELHPCFGIAGVLWCEGLAFAVRPGPPSGR